MTVFDAIAAMEALQKAQLTLHRASRQVDSVALSDMLNSSASTLDKARTLLGTKQVS